MTMREIQELTLAVAAEGNRLNNRFTELHSAIQTLEPRIRQQLSVICLWQKINFIGVPLDPLGLRPVAGRSELAPASRVGVRFTIEGQRFENSYPWGQSNRVARPIVRGERRSSVSANTGLVDEIHGDGSVVLAMMRRDDVVLLGWFLNQLATLLVTIDRSEMQPARQMPNMVSICRWISRNVWCLSYLAKCSSRRTTL